MAELGNFTRAAERCFVVQSALSHQIAKLEQELGARLFHRTSRSVALTPAGAAFLRAPRVPRGRGAGAGRGLCSDRRDPRSARRRHDPDGGSRRRAGRLRALHQDHPRVQISLLTAGSDVLADQVRDGALDVAFLGLAEDVKIPNLDSLQLARDPLAALLARPSPGRPQAHPPGDDQHRGVRGLPRRDHWSRPGGPGVRRSGSGPDGRLRDHRPPRHGALVAEGLCVALLASTYAVKLPGVAVVPVENTSYRLEHVVWSRLGRTPAADAFIARIAATAAG